MKTSCRKNTEVEVNGEKATTVEKEEAKVEPRTT